jgi:hypothetical protein
MLLSFPLVGIQLVWNVGRGTSVMVCVDPWIISGE